PAGSITRGLEGESLTDIAEMAEAGVRLFTDDGRSVRSARVMRLALEYAKAFDVVISQHAQDEDLTQGWQMHEGQYSALLGLAGYPAEAEEIIVARDVALARLTGGRLHLTHVSAGGSVDAIRAARPAGIRGLTDHGGPVAPGRPATLVVVDPSASWMVGERPFHSIGGNSAFLGRTLHGRVVHTLLRGVFTVREGEPTR